MAARVTQAQDLLYSVVRRYNEGERTFKDLNADRMLNLVSALTSQEGMQTLYVIGVQNGWDTDAFYNSYFRKMVEVTDLSSYDIHSLMKRMRLNKRVPSPEAYSWYGAAILKETGNWRSVVEFLALRGAMLPSTWATLTKSLKPDEGVEMFQMMTQRGIQPTVDVFHSLIESHSRGKTNPKGVYDEMRRRGIAPTAQTFELLTAYTSPQTAQKIYEKLAQLGITPSLLTTVRLLEQYSILGDVAMCKKLWSSVKNQTKGATKDELVELLKIFSRIGDPSITLEILDTILNRGILEPILVYSTIIASLTQLNDAPRARTYFDRMEKEDVIPSEAIYNNMVQVHANANDIARVTQYERAMREHRYKVNTASVHAMLGAYARANDTRSAERLLDRAAKEDMQVGAEEYLILIRNAKTSNVLSKWQQEIKKFPPHPDTQRTVLAALVQTKDAKGCVAMYNAMALEERRAAFAYDYALTTCCDAGDLFNAKSILHDARSEKIVLLKATYEKVVEMFAKNRNKEEVANLVQEMETHKISVSEHLQKLLKNLQGGSLVDTLLEEVAEVEKNNEKKGSKIFTKKEQT